jgi:acetyl esterase/lipase
LANLIFGKAHPGVDVSVTTLPDGLSVRPYRPRRPEGYLPVVLYMHGGGWVSGDVGMTDWWCSRLAFQARVAPLLTAKAVEAYVGHYLGPGDPDERRRDPYASPLHAEDMRGLPPALIQVGEHDPLRDEGWRYGRRMPEAGVRATVTEHPGMPHGFALFRGLAPATRQALNEAVHFHL